jgi:3'(2'), 5'-bisphosphate nucleotidase
VIVPAQPTADDHALAAHVAVAAGRALVTLRRKLVDTGLSGPALGDAGDREGQKRVSEALQRAVDQGDAVLSEEAEDDPARLLAERVWVVDPLDGTREFSDPGRTDWAVHVALVIDGQPVAGAVYLPAFDILLATGGPLTVPAAIAAAPRLIVSRTRPPAVTGALAEALGAEVLTLGSAGAKAMAVVQGQADIYLNDGGLNEWDSCAPVAVARAAGLHASRADGSDLQYNQPGPQHGDLLVCRPELAQAALEVLRSWS